MQVNIKHLVDDVQCYQTVRELRWPMVLYVPLVSLEKRVLTNGVSLLQTKTTILVFYKLNSAIERGTKPDA